MYIDKYSSSYTKLFGPREGSISHQWFNIWNLQTNFSTDAGFDYKLKVNESQSKKKKKKTTKKQEGHDGPVTLTWVS